MAYRNKVIRNVRTGHEITFLHTAKDTDGRFLGMVAMFQPQASQPIPHYHPSQTVDLDVLSGELTVWLNGESRNLTVGDHLHIDPNQVYSLWNSSTQPSRINCRVRPAMNTEYLLETITGLANTEKDSDTGLVRVLQTALIANTFSNVVRRTRFPYPLQKTVCTLLAPFAYLAGCKAMYAEYID